MTVKPQLKTPTWSLNPDGEYVYILLHDWSVEAGSILMINTPLSDRVASQYVAHVVCPDDIRGENAALWRARQDKVGSLITPVLSHVSEGHWNAEVKRLLKGVCKNERWAEIAEIIEGLPDRDGLGVRESWCEAFLRLYCMEMSVWWRELGRLRRRAAAYALRQLGKPVIAYSDDLMPLLHDSDV